MAKKPKLQKETNRDNQKPMCSFQWFYGEERASYSIYAAIRYSAKNHDPPRFFVAAEKTLY